MLPYKISMIALLVLFDFADSDVTTCNCTWQSSRLTCKTPNPGKRFQFGLDAAWRENKNRIAFQKKASQHGSDDDQINTKSVFI